MADGDLVAVGPQVGQRLVLADPGRVQGQVDEDFGEPRGAGAGPLARRAHAGLTQDPDQRPRWGVEMPGREVIVQLGILPLHDLQSTQGLRAGRLPGVLGGSVVRGSVVRGSVVRGSVVGAGKSAVGVHVGRPRLRMLGGTGGKVGCGGRGEDVGQAARDGGGHGLDPPPARPGVSPGARGEQVAVVGDADFGADDVGVVGHDGEPALGRLVDERVEFGTGLVVGGGEVGDQQQDRQPAVRGGARQSALHDAGAGCLAGRGDAVPRDPHLGQGSGQVGQHAQTVDVQRWQLAAETDQEDLDVVAPAGVGQLGSDVAQQPDRRVALPGHGGVTQVLQIQQQQPIVVGRDRNHQRVGSAVAAGLVRVKGKAGVTGQQPRHRVLARDERGRRGGRVGLVDAGVAILAPARAAASTRGVHRSGTACHSRRRVVGHGDRRR